MIHYKPESTPVGDRLNSDSTKIREGQGALQKGSEEIDGIAQDMLPGAFR